MFAKEEMLTLVHKQYRDIPTILKKYPARYSRPKY
jgi:hypothetical protein